MSDWFSPAEIASASLGELPSSERAVRRIAQKEGWRDQPGMAQRQPGKGGGWQYHISLLPDTIQMRLQLSAEIEPEAEERDAAWDDFDRLTEAQKQRVRDRLAIIDDYDKMVAAGWSPTAASYKAASNAGISVGTIYNWREKLQRVPRADRLAHLAPIKRGGSRAADCDNRAWEYFTSDYLRPEAPGFSACFRRMEAAANQHGWQHPSERALRRRLEKEISPAVLILAREGRDAAKAIFPAQTRSRTHFHAMEAVNMDGHKLDVFVAVPGNKKPVRVHLIALQDLYSGKFVAWRLAESENKESVRLVIGDMVEEFGIPDKIYLDNGRAFASKWISGGTPNRYRFKVKDSDPRGLLTTLGVRIIWTTPYSGQSKPIERAFRDLAEEICKHPICAGAYTGNKPDAKPENYGNAAIPLEELRAHVDTQLRAHNARPGRRSEVAAGRSFDEAFNQSLAAPDTIVRVASIKQRALWLTAAERVRARKGNGEIHLAGNRYWAPELTAHAGTPVTVRFDPDKLHDPVLVYDASDRLIATAAIIEKSGFDSQDAARTHANKRNAWLKAVNEQRRLATSLSVDELARIAAGTPTPEETEPVNPKIVRIVNGPEVEPENIPHWGEEENKNFARGLKILTGGRDDDA